MSQFSIAVRTPAEAPILIPSTMNIMPQAWSADAVGGMWDATIELGGSIEELAGITSWLGYQIDILDDQGTSVWWGDIVAAEVVIGGARGGITLEYLANRIQVRYVQIQPGGGTLSADTEWVDDLESQAKYGVWEKRLSATRPLSATEAVAYRNSALTKLAAPSYTLRTDRGADGGLLYCTGFWQRNRRVYYAQDAGFIQHSAQGTSAPLGLGFTSALVAFVARDDKMHSIPGYFKNFAKGMRFKTSGAGNGTNNAANWLVSQGEDVRDVKVYTSTGVDFSPNDDMLDSNQGLSFLAVDDVFTISGTNTNNGTHLVDKEGASAIEVSAGYHGSLVVSESPGDTVVFSRGNAIGVDGALANEHVGSSVTVTVWGQKHYQPFVLTTDDFWTAAFIEIQLRKVGTPSDDITVQLVADSSGSPGTVLITSTVAASSIPTEMGWVSFNMGNSVMLNPSTTYGIVVLRTGANHPDNYYEIELDEKATYTGGTYRQWDGATWQIPSPTADLIFRVLGSVDTGTQVQMALAEVGWPQYSIDSTGVFSNQFREGEVTAFDELEVLLAIGATNSPRLVAQVLRNRAVVVKYKPGVTEARWVLKDGKLQDLHGQDAPVGFVPAGEWVHIGSVDRRGPWTLMSPVFIERAEFRPDSGITLEPEGSKSPFDLGVLQG